MSQYQQFQSLIGIAVLVILWPIDGVLAATCNVGDAFAPQAIYGVTRTPSALVATDIDSNGTADLVVSSYDDNVVSLLINDGSGHFTSKIPFWPDAGQLVFVDAADINSDGHTDLAIASFNGEFVRLGTGDGSGAFTRSGVLRAYFDTTVAVFIDLNTDDLPDIVASHARAGLAAYLNVGEGVYRDSGQFELEDYSGHALLVTDVNADELPDLIQVRQTFSAGDRVSDVQVFLGLGDGTLQLPRSIRLDGMMRSVAAGDLNRDGAFDLVLAGDADAVTVLLGKGNGDFSVGGSYGVTVTPTWISVVDVDKDGMLDLAIASEGDQVSVVSGQGDGTFGEEVLFDSGHDQSSIVVSDLNQDGQLDLVVANGADNTISVLLNQCESCAMDFDKDGNLTLLDFLVFKQLWWEEDSQAELDKDGAFTLFDFLEFQRRFMAGCA